MKKKLAIVGCGRVSKRHLGALAENKETIEISYVCDKDESRAKAYSEQLGVPYVTKMEDLNGKGIDVVSILTPSGLHPRHIARLAEYTDIPDIICEKPISLTVREAFELYRRVDKAGKKLYPVYQNRYNPLVEFVRELINSDKLGKVFQFNCNVFWNRNDAYFNIDWHGTQELDGGVLYTQASHYVDMLHFLFGEVKEHKGIGGSQRKLEVFDTVSAVLSFESGTVGTLNATVSTYEKNYQTEFTVIGEKGTVRLSGTNLNQIDFWNVEGMEKPDIDFQLDHVYGKGHDKMYEYYGTEQFDKFPSRDDVISGIRLMEMLSYG